MAAEEGRYYGRGFNEADEICYNYQGHRKSKHFLVLIIITVQKKTLFYVLCTEGK